MLVKKAGGKVYGATFTAAERKAMEMEINRNGSLHPVCSPGFWP